MKSALALAATLLLLSACEITHSNAAADTAAGIQQYTTAQQDQAAKEAESLQCPMLNTFANDFMTMRDEARAAKGEL